MNGATPDGARFPYNWGATAREVAARYPCDRYAPDPDVVLWRAVDVAAPPATVYRWLQQLRIAPYSYDLVDNFALRSPRRLTPRAATLAPGQRIMHVFRLLEFDPPRTLTIGPGAAAGVKLFGALYGTYAVSEAAGGARLVVKVCANVGPAWYARAYARALPLLDFVMMRKQLLTLKACAERSARRG